MKLISVSGHIGAGKDTFGQIISDITGYEIIKFVTALRHEVYELKNLPKDKMGDRLFENTPHAALDGATVRSWLRKVGSSHRMENPCYWIDKLANSLNSNASGYVITDLRYPNEFGWVKYMGGTTVYIKRQSIDIANLENHESEAYHGYLQRVCDYLIFNDTLDVLKNKAEEIFSQEKTRAIDIWEPMQPRESTKSN